MRLRRTCIYLFHQIHLPVSLQPIFLLLRFVGFFSSLFKRKAKEKPSPSVEPSPTPSKTQQGNNFSKTNTATTGSLRGCLHDTGATFAPGRVHSGSLSWLYICLHDTTTKCYAGASHPGVSSPRFSHRGENFTPVRNLATVSCKRETTTHFGVKSVCR